MSRLQKKKLAALLSGHTEGLAEKSRGAKTF